MNGEKMGSVCTLHPAVLAKIDRKAAVVVAELDMDRFAAVPEKDIQYQEPSKYPGMDWDLSLVIPEGTTFAALRQAWEGDAFPLLQGVSLVDSFDDGRQKSMAFRFYFSSSEKTLTREEVQPSVDAILSNLEKMGIVLKA